MKETHEQLRELARRFYDPEQARRIAEEIEQAETQLRSFALPSIRPEVISRIKRRVTARSARPVFRYWQAVAAVAACLALTSALLLINRPHPPAAGPRLPLASIQPWEDDLLADADVADTISNELDEISDQLQDLQASQWDQPSAWQQDIFELEDSELITSTSFWKG